MSNGTARYTKTAVVLHWLIGFGILGMLAFGWYMSGLPKEAPKALAFDLFDWGIYTWQVSEPISPRTFYFNLHKSIGVTLLALIAIRVFWRLTHEPPALLDTLKSWEKKLAENTHKVLYLLMIAMPVSGLVMATYSKYGVKWFGFPLIRGLDNNGLREIFLAAHQFFGAVLTAVIVLHIAGALKHKFIDKDETLKRMSFH
jgi:cytochrome b561